MWHCHLKHQEQQHRYLGNLDTCRETRRLELFNQVCHLLDKKTKQRFACHDSHRENGVPIVIG